MKKPAKLTSPPTVIEHFHYYLDRGDLESARGYQAFIITVENGTTKYAHVSIDDELKKNPKDKKLKALLARAVAITKKCVVEHYNSRIVSIIGGSELPRSYNVFCNPDHEGCGNSMVTCDPSGRSFPAPSPAIH